MRERVLDDAAQLAGEKLAKSGLPPLPHVTPHTLRRTYVSIMLLATEGVPVGGPGFMRGLVGCGCSLFLRTRRV